MRYTFLRQPLRPGLADLRYDSNYFQLHLVLFLNIEVICKWLEQIFAILAHITIDNLIRNSGLRLERNAA